MGETNSGDQGGEVAGGVPTHEFQWLERSEWMRPLLAGRVTQGRRPVKAPRVQDRSLRLRDIGRRMREDDGAVWFDEFGWVLCPYGLIGDHLWVREPFKVDFPHLKRADLRAAGLPSLAEDRFRATICYKATPGEWFTRDVHLSLRPAWSDAPIEWRPSIHMPRWVCRLVLEVTRVRVSRVQNITDADALAEGIYGASKDGNLTKYGWDGLPWTDWTGTPREAYALLWDSINGKRDGGAYAWERNPWVWAIDWRPVQSPDATISTPNHAVQEAR